MLKAPFAARGVVVKSNGDGAETVTMDQDRFNKRFDRKREEEERYKKTLPGPDDEPLPPPPEPAHKEAEPGRNDPCPCGSGKKYKLCCLKKKR